MHSTHPVYNWIQTLITDRGHCVCLGLDPDMRLLPDYYPQTLTGLQDFLFNAIDESLDHVIAYKPNIAFFESMGIDGLRLLEACVTRIDHRLPVIMDAKRGDIGTTAYHQAKYIFDYWGADATTLHPYMGFDSLQPFFERTDQYQFVLALTSNPGRADFAQQRLETGETLYESVLNQCCLWHARYHNVGCVVGAQQAPLCRAKAANLLFLMPGVGHQGGAYHTAYQTGKNQDALAIIPVSRALLYPHATTQTPGYLYMQLTQLIRNQ